MPNGRHLAICGHSRSGSTLLYAMMRAACAGLNFLDREAAAASVIGRPGDHATKRPLDVFFEDDILRANVLGKRLDYVVTIRDPRALLVSRHAAVPDDYFMDADRQYFVPDGAPPSKTTVGLLEAHNAIAELGAGGRWDGLAVVRYEDLVRDPDAEQARLGAALGLEFAGRFAEFHERGVPEGLARPLNGLRAPETSRLDAWRAPEHRARIADQFTRFPALFDLVRMYGYEADDSWFAGFGGRP